MQDYVFYNHATAAGKIIEITPVTEQHDHKILNFTINCENSDGSKSFREKFLHVKAWDERAEKMEAFKVGDHIQIKVSVASKENKNRPGLWYHVITLKEVYNEG